MKRLWYSLRFRLMLFVLIAAMPALGLTLYTGSEQRKNSAAAVQADALRLARFAAINQELIIENTRGFLIALSHIQVLEAGGIQDCSKVFSHMQEAHYPFYTGFYVADLEANVLCSAPPEERPEDLNECVHYKQLLQEREFVISEYHFCKRTGKAVISMGYPVLDSDEVFVGVVNVGIDLAWFNQLAAGAKLPPGAALTVLDQAGVILAHYPDADSWVGKEFPETDLYEMMVAQGEGTTEIRGVDDVSRLYAFTPLWSTEGNVFVTISIPSNVAYAEANQTMLRNLALISGATVLALIAAWILGEAFILRQTRTLLAATQRLASGHLETRTDIPYNQGEIGQLAQSFDQMAVSIEQREIERDQAEAAMKAYAEELERSNRDLQDFANIASHDLQEPLRKIQIFSDLLQAHYKSVLDERGVDYLQRMQSAAIRMQNLIDDLLSYSRIATKAQPFTRVDLNSIVKDVLLDLDMQIENTKAQIEVEKLPTIEADPTQMNQLIQNLVSNALKFHKAEQPPVVKISAQTGIKEPTSSGAEDGRMDGKYCHIIIQDNGIGFDKKYAERIFNPFQRLHGREKYEGTGMGLAICRKIVERHGGWINAEGKKGEGAAFIVTLPLRQPAGDN